MRGDTAPSLVKLPTSACKTSAVLRALALYAQTALDYGDVFIVATTEQAGTSTLYSYGAKLGKLPGITRQEP